MAQPVMVLLVYKMSQLGRVKVAQSGFIIRVEEFVCHWTFYFLYTNSRYFDDFVCILLLVAFWNGVSLKTMRTRSPTLNSGCEPGKDCRFGGETKWGTNFALTTSAAIPMTDFAACSQGIQNFEVAECTWKFDFPQNSCIVKSSMSLCTFQPCSFWFPCMYGKRRSHFLCRIFWTHLWTLYLHQPTTSGGTHKFQS